MRQALADLDSDDTSIVVSGSLARDEFTEGSEVDWTLLIDGLSDPGHYALTNRIDQVVRGFAAKDVGREGTFGTMVFSHDLVHQIGGGDDTIGIRLGVYCSCSNRRWSVVKTRTEESYEMC